MASRSWLTRHHSILPAITRAPQSSPTSVFTSATKEPVEETLVEVDTPVGNDVLNESRTANATLQDTQLDAEAWVLKQDELEQAFQVAVNTTLEAMSMEPNRKEVEDYINKAFDLPEQVRAKLWDKAKHKQPSGLKLCGKLISACDIPARDANGKSDPYCLVGIISESDRNRDKVKTGNLLQWKKEGLVAEVFRSTTKPATLEPDWNEEFELPIDNLAEQVLVIEVWDSDEATVGVSEIKGAKGFGMFLKDLKHTDDFIGRTFLSLKDVQPQGGPGTLTLYSHTAKHQRGNVWVHLAIKGQEEGKISLTMKMDQSMLLFKALVMHEAQKGNHSYQKDWNAEMGVAARELLTRHAAYYGLGETHQAAVHLSVLFDYHKIFGVQPHLFAQQLDHIIKAAGRKPISVAFSQNGGPGTPGDWVDKLLGALEGLLTEVYSVLCSHLILMDVTITAGVESLTGWIQVMAKLYQLGDLVARLPVDRRSLKTALELSIQTSVEKWYRVTSEKASQISTVSTLNAVCKSCLTLCETIQNSIRPAVRKKADVDYLACYFASLDKLLSPAMMECLASWDYNDVELANTSYEIYLNIKHMCEIAKLAEGNNIQDIQLFGYQHWFKKMVLVWLSVALARCKEKIDKAVQVDQIASVTDQVGYSSSLVDTSIFLYQVVEFWNNLGWSCPEETYTFMMELINYISEAALHYVEQIYTRVSNRSLLDKNTGNFTVTTQLCTILNNMEYMQQKMLSQSSKNVPSLVEELKLQSSFEWLQREKGIGDQAKKLVEVILDSAANDIEHKVTVVNQQLGEQFIPTISRFINDIVGAAEGAKTEQVLIPLEEYLNTNLKTLSSNLLFSVFRILLEDIWKATVDALSKSVSTLPKKPNQKYLYQRLRDSLEFLHGFFNAGGEGLTGEQLETEQYKVLLNDLDLMCLSTRELVLRCCADLAEQQAKVVGSSEHKYGELTLSVGYIKETGNVEVTIFQGRNLPALDKSGLSDPYIELALLPGFLFQSGSKKAKTPVQYKTLNPTFNYESVLPASQESMEVKGTIVVLGAYDHDILGKNDFMGICVVSCNDIPQLSNSSSLLDANSPKRRNMTLPLFHIGESKALQELALRHHFSDHEAVEFLNVLSKNYHKQKQSASPFFARLSLKNINY
ncbi:hypothetical protein EMCRGX_G027674 [Ephydatia muelleri]